MKEKSHRSLLSRVVWVDPSSITKISHKHSSFSKKGTQKGLEENLMLIENTEQLA